MTYEWDDLKCFLAVARTRSALAASRVLGVSQSTIARRIEALERALGAALFERTPSGYVLTEAGATALEAAEAVEREAVAFAARFPAGARRAAGPLRITTNDLMAQAILTPALGALQRASTEDTVELVICDTRLDLLKGEADLALRAGSRPDDPGLVRQKLPGLSWGVYCSRSYEAERGAPAGVADLASHAVILGADMAARIPAVAWLEAATGDGARVSRATSLAGVFSAVKAGVGVSILPTAVANADGGLTRCFRAPEGFDDQLWLTYPATLRGDPRLRRLVAAITDRVREVRRADD